MLKKFRLDDLVNGCQLALFVWLLVLPEMRTHGQGQIELEDEWKISTRTFTFFSNRVPLTPSKTVKTLVLQLKGWFREA